MSYLLFYFTLANNGGERFVLDLQSFSGREPNVRLGKEFYKKSLGFNFVVEKREKTITKYNV